MAEENVFGGSSARVPSAPPPAGSAPVDPSERLAESEIASVAHRAPPGEDEKATKKKKKKKKKKKPEAGTLGTSRGIETMFRTSYRVNMDLSALADTKSNIMISINGLIISIILGTIASKIDANYWLLVPTPVLLIGCLISMTYAVLAARPRVSSRMITLEDVRNNSANILFFGNFVHLSQEDYIQGMTELLQNTDRLYFNMIRDIYGLGNVLQKKFRLLRISYTVFMVALILGVLAFILTFVWVVATVPAAAAS
jgi:hypothetical protein